MDNRDFLCLIETATFLMSLKAQQERRMVRWDAAREEIVEALSIGKDHL